MSMRDMRDSERIAIDDHGQCVHNQQGAVDNAPEESYDRRKTAKTIDERLDRTRERNRNAQRRCRERLKVRSALPASQRSGRVAAIGIFAANSTLGLARPYVAYACVDTSRMTAGSICHLTNVPPAPS